jgi:hypothetical protein
MLKNIFASFFIGISVISCIQKPNFPLEPSISIAGISNIRILDKNSSTPSRQIFKDSVTISINFKDGNGDLGVNEADKNKLSEKGEFNYLVKRFVKIKGQYVSFDPKPSHSGNFITLKSGTKEGPIEGIINYALEFLPLNGTKKDTVKFEIKIVDRARNTSNAAITDSVLVNELNKKSIILN